MLIEFKPVASDGQFTIGYDADGVAGIVEGNMVDTVDLRDLQRVREGHTFIEGGGDTFVAQNEFDSFGNEVLFWNQIP